MTPSIPWQSEKTLNFPISSWPHCNAVGSTSNAVGTNPSGNAVGISCPSDIPPLTHTVDPYDGAPRMHEYKSLCKDKKDSCRISIKRHHKRCDEQTVHGNVDVSAIHSLFDFLLRRLIIKCVCYFPEFVSFKALREISCERIWVNLNLFGNPFWHPFKHKTRSVLRSTISSTKNETCAWALNRVFLAILVVESQGLPTMKC